MLRLMGRCWKGEHPRLDVLGDYVWRLGKLYGCISLTVFVLLVEYYNYNLRVALRDEEEKS